MSDARPDPEVLPEEWWTDIRRRVRRALVAAYGVEVGTEAASDATTWAWEHRSEVVGMKNPAGYLYRVGQSASRRYRRGPVGLPASAPRADDLEHDVDPRLPAALATLSERQRSAVLLVHAHDYDLATAAEVLGCSVSSLRNHLARGLRHLRAQLGDDSDA
jgi:DNA-directed RNA polymerase specialized sigma24 family protein